MTFHYLLGLGSNDRAEEHLAGMVEALLGECGALWLSPVCRTRAAGGSGDDYLNAVVSVESALAPPDFRAVCKAIELQLGRVRSSERCAADIDILAFSEKPSLVKGEGLMAEEYLQPQVDCLLAKLGLRAGDGSCEFPNRVLLRLSDGRGVGLDIVELRAA